MRSPVFASDLPGVAAVHVDYDASIWTRTPRPGEDRTDWCGAHLAAYAADRGLGPGEAEYIAAEDALNHAADTLLTHTCAFVALPGSAARGTAVVYVDVMDQQLGRLEHATPEVFVGMQDLKPDGPAPKARWFPAKGKGAWLVAHDLSTDHDTGRVEHVTRAHRLVEPPGQALVHLYAMSFFYHPHDLGSVLSLINHTRVELTTGTMA